MSGATMRAWVIDDPGPIDTHPLQLIERAVPEPGFGQVRVRVLACGVCRTDLHLAEGELRPNHQQPCPGHEIVGVVDQLGPGCGVSFAIDDRIGVPWLGSTCGTCPYCAEGRENLCMAPSFTGWDLNGGYAEYAIVDEAFAYRLPEKFGDLEIAPLLCAGIIGYRALQRAELPPGGVLGIYGFGGSAHLTAQIAMSRGARVHVLTRSAEARALALELGAASAADADDAPPEQLDSAILFAPVGELVLRALAALRRGGSLAIAGIHLSDIPALNYEKHLFQERTLRSVTANTRSDGREFLELASRIDLHVTVAPYGFDRANDALRDLAHDRVNGAAVLVVGDRGVPGTSRATETPT